MKKITKTWQFKSVIVIASLLLFFMAAAGINNRKTNAPAQILVAAMQPFQRLGSAVFSGFGKFNDKYIFYDEIQQQNQNLQKQVSELENKLVEFDKIKAENQQLKEFYNIQEKNPEWQMVSASVIGRDPLAQFYAFTIDKGTLHGVEVGDTVIADGGSLVGIIRETGPNFAVVTTLLDPELTAAAMISRTRDSGLAGGNAELAEQGFASMMHITRETKAIVGDMVITTGLGGVFPKELKVGTIQDLQPDSSGKSLFAFIKPYTDPASVRSVMVITSFS